MTKILSQITPITQEVVEVASWNRQRTVDELRAFISRREDALMDVADFSI